MYLKQLSLLGFKSFANKTNVRFSSGLTAIVGPNGCGKTNILDSLRWVLGEQKVTLLRGSRMEEVIFNGTAEAKPLGMAEVTLTMVNNRGVLPTEYREVQITRRLFRSGESEYLLNKVPCRLKDITELFYDTGVGTHSYAVIQPEMIDAVISDKAEERRFLFEEAAGITKYKQRKRAALRKLEATETDFLRLTDILTEVQTRVRSLKRQYKKAERYQKLANAIKGWELHLSSSRIKALENEKRELKGQAETLGDQLEGTRASLGQASAKLESDRKQQVDMDRELADANNVVHEISESAHHLETEISVLREKKSNAGTLIEHNEADIEALTKRAEFLKEQIADIEIDIQSQTEVLQATRADLTDAEGFQAKADHALLEGRGAKENENRRLIELEGKLLSGKTEQENLSDQEQELAEGVKRTQDQLDECHDALTRIDSEVGQRTEAVQQLENSVTRTEQEQSALVEETEQAIGESESCAETVSDTSAAVEACQARRDLLNDMIIHYEGYGSGVRAAMESRDLWPGLLGTVAELFVPAEGSEPAVEAALGELARFAVCQDRISAEKIIAHLRSENKGGIGFLVPDTGTLNPVLKRPEITLPEFRGWLDDFVKTEDSLRPLMQAVLSRVAVFDADADPSELLTHLPYGFRAVSTSGIMYGTNLIIGGAEDALPLFRRAEKVAEQETVLQELKDEQQQAKLKRDQLIARIAEMRAQSAAITEKIETLRGEHSTARSELSETEYERRTKSADISRLEQEQSTLRQKLETIQNRQLSLGLDRDELSQKKASLSESATRIGAELDELEAAASEALGKVTSLQVGCVEKQSLVDQTRSKLDHSRELYQEITGTVETKEREIESARADIDHSTGRTKELEIQLKESFESRMVATGRQGDLRTTQAEIAERLDGLERELKQQRSEKDSLGEEAHRIEIRLNTIDSEIVTIVDRIREEYELDVSSVVVHKPDEDVSDDEARELLIQKKDALRQFGAVNLLALEEYESTAEREKFLREQLTDLSAAQTDLKTTINKINQTAKQLFSETFTKVQENFSRMFLELFSGGEASISLENPDDPLESGISITARPRGKKLLSITQMSGGERALTAISLLFSLYLVKPSPFCILDEIDAPLDDANCHRFLKIIKTFADQTQFIAITHNKITMEASDNLYGITMDHPGISQMVAVKFAGQEPGSDTDDVQLDYSKTGNHENESAPTSPDENELPVAVAERMQNSVTTGEEPNSDE